MEAVFCILLYIILAPLAYFSLRRTPLEISINRGVFAGVFLFRELFGLIGLAVVLLNIYSPNYFHGFRNTDEGSVFFISLVVFYGLIVFLLTVGVLLKSLFFGAYKRMQEMPSANSLNMVEYKNFLRLGFSLALLGLVIALYGSIRYGAEHAFLGALIYGGDLREIRLANIHVAEMPTFFNSFRGFCYIFLAAVLGGMSFYKSRFSFVFFALTVLYLSTYGGSKAPPVQAFIVYLVSSSCFSGFRIDLRAFLKIIIASVVIVSSIVFVVWLQKGNMNIGEFLSYIVNRLGVGQMAGTYEQFNLKLRNPSYVLHAVPFAGYLTEYPVFQKELMMASEFVNDAASTGVKNSFFISEAYAFGGMHMVVFSPFVVGASYAISLFVVFIMVRYLFVKNIMASIRLSGVLFSSYFSLTGGMSEWLFFKALIMVCIFFVPVYGVFLVLAAVSRIKITFGRLAFHKVHLV